MRARAAIVAVVGYFAGCATAASLTPCVRSFHDEAREVTCWIVPQVGIACVPDWRLERPDPDFGTNAIVQIAGRGR